MNRSDLRLTIDDLRLTNHDDSQSSIVHRQSSIIFFIGALSILPAASRLAWADTVHQRGGLPVIEGQITKIDEGGITIKREFAQPDFIRWDLIREVEKTTPDPLLDRYKGDAANLWRARSRLERHDAASAEPLFERLFEKYRGQTHETALLVAEGLLRCRLVRGANDLAVIPALETARLRASVSSATIFSSLPAVLDERTQLCPHLPPTWVITPNLVKLERDLAAYQKSNSAAIAALAALYRRAVSQQLAIRHDDVNQFAATDHPGVAFLRTMVDLQSTEPSIRETARQAALRDLPNAANWAQAWSHYFIGLSQLNDDLAARDRGLVQLAHVPARYGAFQPFLAGLALATLAEACEVSGDAAAAASLRSELATRYPNHPGQASNRRKTAMINTTLESIHTAHPVRFSKEEP